MNTAARSEERQERQASRFVSRQLSRKQAHRESLFARMGFDNLRRAHNPNIGGVVQSLSYSLYDQVSFAQSAAFTRTILFQSPLGQAGKTLAQTNLSQAGSLPTPQRFTIYKICAHISNNTIPADLQNLLQNVSFQLAIGSKVYQQGPLSMFPAGRGWKVDAAANVGVPPAGSAPVFSTSNGPLSSDAGLLDIPITIEETEQFSVSLNPETAFNLTANSTNPPGVGTVITVYLDGNLERGVS